MRLLQITSLLLVGLLLTNSCKKNKQDTVAPEQPKNYPSKNITVKLPSGSPVNLTKATVLAMNTVSTINANGGATIPFQAGYTQLVTVHDEQHNVMLMGFINDRNAEISLTTTTEVLIYYASGAVIQPYQIRDTLLQKIRSVNGFNELVINAENRFKTDPLIVQKGTLLPAVKTWISNMETTEVIDIAGKTILVEPTDVKSGLQVAELDNKSIEITNFFRRRGFGFVYKTGYKDQSNIQHIAHQTITDNASIFKTQKIDPTTAVRDVIGVVADASLGYLSGKGLEFAAIKNGPVEIPLGETDKETYYKLRIVGPSINPNGTSLELTAAEDRKLDELWIDFFTIDLLLPIMLDLWGHKDLLNGGKVDLKESFKGLIDIVSGIMSATPELVKELKEGNFKAAVTEFLFAWNKGQAGTYKDVYTALMAGIIEAEKARGALDPKIGALVQKDIGDRVEKFAKILEVIDIVLKVNDYATLYDKLLNSRKIEEWDLRAKSTDVVLTPKTDAITTSFNHLLTANTKMILADGETFVYKWGTSGKYGTLRDAVHNGTSFESSQKTVTYRTTVSASTLGDKNVEEIYVTVFVKKGTQLREIDVDTATVTIRPLKLEMRPVNKKLSPKDGIKSVRMYLVRSDGTDDFEGSAGQLDYRFEWSTAGTYGKFNGSLNNATTTKPEIVYEALDREVRNAWETVNVNVYFKAKNETRWVLREKVVGKLNIINDPKIIIMHRPVTTKDTMYVSGNTQIAMVWNLAIIPKVDSAKRYSVRFYGFKRRSSYEGYTSSWNEGQAPPAPWPMYSGSNGIMNGQYHVAVGRSWCNGGIGGGCGGESITKYIAAYATWAGSVEVTVELK